MLVYLAMFFVAFELLSMVFNQYFYDFVLFGMTFPLNISVVFFCIGFFVLDLTTELYDDKAANKLIYGKILCQIIFVVFGYLGIVGAGLQHSQLANVIFTTPIMILNAIVASLVGYKLTARIMQILKIKYNGRFLMLRYLFSTLPGELVFSLIFSALSFSHGKTIKEYLIIFLSLSAVKVILSLLFSCLVIPLTRVLKLFTRKGDGALEFVPFI